MTHRFSNNKLLIKQLKKGNEKAYTFLVDEFHQGLCVYASSLIHDHAIAEDIVQNVFIRIWSKRKKLKDEFTIKSFLYKSVYNEFIDQYRKQQVVLAIEKKYIEAIDYLVEKKDDSDFKKLLNHLKQLIRELPPKSKEVFILSKTEGLTNIEISEHLNISVKTVEGHITKSFTFLRKRLENKGLDMLL